MGLFILSTEIKESIQSCQEYAENPINWYHPDEPNSTPPGMLHRHTLQSGTIKSVFSWTEQKGEIYRHLSVSTNGRGKYPIPTVVWTLAHLFGFTGGGAPDEKGLVAEPGEDWVFMPNAMEGCVIVIQRVILETGLLN